MRFPFLTSGRGGIWYCLQSLLTSPHVLHRRGARVVVSFGTGAWEDFIVTRLDINFDPLLHFQMKIFL